MNLAPKRSQSCPPRLSYRALESKKLGYEVARPPDPPPCPLILPNIEFECQPSENCGYIFTKDHMWPHANVWCNCRPPKETRLCDVCLMVNSDEEGGTENIKVMEKQKQTENTQRLIEVPNFKAMQNLGSNGKFREISEVTEHSEDSDDDSYCSACEELSEDEEGQVHPIYRTKSFYECLDETNYCGLPYMPFSENHPDSGDSLTSHNSHVNEHQKGSLQSHLSSVNSRTVHCSDYNDPLPGDPTNFVGNKAFRKARENICHVDKFQDFSSAVRTNEPSKKQCDLNLVCFKRISGKNCDICERDNKFQQIAGFWRSKETQTICQCAKAEHHRCSSKAWNNGCNDKCDRSATNDLHCKDENSHISECFNGKSLNPHLASFGTDVVYGSPTNYILSKNTHSAQCPEKESQNINVSRLGSLRKSRKCCPTSETGNEVIEKVAHKLLRKTCKNCCSENVDQTLPDDPQSKNLKARNITNSQNLNLTVVRSAREPKSEKEVKENLRCQLRKSRIDRSLQNSQNLKMSWAGSFREAEKFCGTSDKRNGVEGASDCHVQNSKYFTSTEPCKNCCSENANRSRTDSLQYSNCFDKKSHTRNSALVGPSREFGSCCATSERRNFVKESGLCKSGLHKCAGNTCGSFCCNNNNPTLSSHIQSENSNSNIQPNSQNLSVDLARYIREPGGENKMKKKRHRQVTKMPDPPQPKDFSGHNSQCDLENSQYVNVALTGCLRESKNENKVTEGLLTKSGLHRCSTKTCESPFSGNVNRVLADNFAYKDSNAHNFHIKKKNSQYLNLALVDSPREPKREKEVKENLLCQVTKLGLHKYSKNNCESFCCDKVDRIQNPHYFNTNSQYIKSGLFNSSGVSAKNVTSSQGATERNKGSETQPKSELQQYLWETREPHNDDTAKGVRLGGLESQKTNTKNKSKSVNLFSVFSGKSSKNLNLRNNQNSLITKTACQPSENPGKKIPDISQSINYQQQFYEYNERNNCSYCERSNTYLDSTSSAFKDPKRKIYNFNRTNYAQGMYSMSPEPQDLDTKNCSTRSYKNEAPLIDKNKINIASQDEALRLSSTVPYISVEKINMEYGLETKPRKSQAIIMKIQSFLYESFERFTKYCSQIFNIHNNYLKLCGVGSKPESLEIQGTTINSSSTDDEPNIHSITCDCGKEHFTRNFAISPHASCDSLKDYYSSEKLLCCCNLQTQKVTTDNTQYSPTVVDKPLILFNNVKYNGPSILPTQRKCGSKKSEILGSSNYCHSQGEEICYPQMYTEPTSDDLNNNEFRISEEDFMNNNSSNMRSGTQGMNELNRRRSRNDSPSTLEKRCGGPRSFCCPSECYKFSSCNGVVNQPSSFCSAPITCSTLCDPCGGEQKLGARQNPSYIKFSAMPSPPISIEAGTSSSANTKLQKKPSKPGKRNATKCNKEDVNRMCKSGPKEIVSKGDVSKRCEADKAQGSISKIDAEVCRIPSTTGDDKVSCEVQFSANDIIGNISKATSCDSRTGNVITKTSSDDIFDVITDDNVILRCQCHCDCQKSHQPFNLINPKSCSRNRDQLSMPLSGFCNSIKVNGLSATHCSWRIPEHKKQFNVPISDTNMTSFGISNCSTFNRNKGFISNNPPSQFHKYSSKSSSQLQTDHRMEVIDEECECEECTCKHNRQSMTATPPHKHNPNQNDFKTFGNDNHGKSGKPLEETCIDFLNIICDNILESVENSFNEILRGNYHQMLTKMDEMQSKLERNETMMSRLYCGIMEKMAEQNENSLRQFRKMLEFLVEKETNNENQRHGRNCQTNNPTNCSNKGCQCDLYTRKMEATSPTHNDVGKSPKFSWFDVNGHEFTNTRKGGVEKGNRSWTSNSTNRTVTRRCICCNSEMKQENRPNTSQATSGGCWSRQRSMGGANDTIQNYQTNVSLPETKNSDFTDTHDYSDRNSSDEKGNSRPSSNCRMSQPYPFDRLSTSFPTNSSEQISDAKNSCSGRENSSTSLTANKTHGTVRILGQCNNSLQTTRNDDNDTSGYATEPEDNANDEITYGGDNRKKLSFTKSKNHASSSESDKADFMEEAE